MRFRWWWVVVVVVVIGVIIWYRVPQGPTTRLVIEITGGFAFVPTPPEHMLEVAYLEDVKLFEDMNGDGDESDAGELVCEVDQIGTELMVVRGKIVSAAQGSSPATPPASKKFNLDKAVITFPQLETANIPLKFKRNGWPPTPPKPLDPSKDAEWADLQFVPGLRHYHSASIPPTWRSSVNGRVVLKGGTVVAARPSDPQIEKASFDFKTTAGTQKFQGAVTDKTIYTVDVPGTQIELAISNATNGYTKLVLEPNATGEAVRLTLRGLHAAGTAASLGGGDRLKDFCAFYSLVEPRPKFADWLVPHYVAAALPSLNQGPFAGGQPSPGFFCTGDGF
jgi:hypothetical protein